MPKRVSPRFDPRSRAASFIGRAAAVFLLLFSAAAITSYGAFAEAKTGAIVRGVTVSGIDVGGMRPEQAADVLRNHVRGLHLTFVTDDGKKVRVPAVGGDDTPPVAAFDVNDAVRRASTIGRERNPAVAVFRALTVPAFGADVAISVALDRSALEKTLATAFSGDVKQAQDARLRLTRDSSGRFAASVLPERVGITVAAELAALATEDRLHSLSPLPIRVVLAERHPTLTRSQVQTVARAAEEAAERAPLTLTADDVSWNVGGETLAGWITALANNNGGARLTIDSAAVERFLRPRGDAIAAAPKDAAFTMDGGRVIEFVPSEDGRAIDYAVVPSVIEDAVFGSEKKETVALPIATIKPAVTTKAANPYGISGVIGVGETNFRGSPNNRRANIKIGATSLNGLLVEPDKEFSLLKALGDIDQAHGYLPELVIKGDKTAPEYGGGLCQIGSTTFRAVLASGLPVTERRNHSYRVPYYERDGAGGYIGPGKDATIYDPAPDFKFKNDTDGHILIMTTIKGDRLTFTFWGAPDGRKAEQTDARVFNIIEPPPKKTVETTELKPGEVKCTERPHPGSDATFTYTVTYPDGEVKKHDFFSRYRPWGEVCLVGVDPNAPKAETAPALPSADAVGATGQ